MYFIFFIGIAFYGLINIIRILSKLIFYEKVVGKINEENISKLPSSLWKDRGTFIDNFYLKKDMCSFEYQNKTYFIEDKHILFGKPKSKTKDKNRVVAYFNRNNPRKYITLGEINKIRVYAFLFVLGILIYILEK